jgi:hypothetical protein
MRKRVLISTPYPSVEEVAREFKLTRAELAEVKQLVARVISEDTSNHTGALVKRKTQSRRRRSARSRNSN